MLKKISAILIITFICGKTLAQYKGGISDGYSLCVMTKTIVLPIELLDFGVAYDDKCVHVNWSTLSEINNEYFEIERSSDLLLWNIIAHIKGVNNSNQLVKYECSDVSPVVGISYYRLKQVDFDGKSSYSKVLSLKIEEIEHNIIEVYPNPVTSNIVHFNNATEEPFLITIYSQLGQFVFQKMLNGSSIELPNLMHGVYVLKFENLISGDVQYARMVKGE